MKILKSKFGKRWENNQFGREKIPKITVITVVYNGEKYLEETINSVIKQNYKNFEYIIIDGKSTDRTISIIKKYEHKIDYWISERDDGIYDAMNKGIKLARGEIINLLNCGDTYYNKNILSEIAEKFNNKDIYFVLGRTKFINNDGGEYQIVPGKAVVSSLKVGRMNRPDHRHYSIKKSYMPLSESITQNTNFMRTLSSFIQSIKISKLKEFY